MPYTVGPDGYAVELMTYGLQKKYDIEPALFVQSMFDEFSEPPARRLRGLRQIAQRINVLRPGLYTELRNLAYGTESWQEGLSLVETAIAD